MSGMNDLGEEPLLERPPRSSNPAIALVQWAQESMEKGRARSSTLSLVSCALGTGILALPHAFCQCGIVVASCVVLLAAVMNAYVCQLLIRACDKTDSTTYEDIGVTLFGTRSKKAMDYVQAFVLFGITTALLIVCGDTFSGVLQASKDLSSSDTAKRISDFCTVKGGTDNTDVPTNCRLVATAMPMALVILPLSLMKDMSSLRFASTICVSSVFFVMIALIIRASEATHALGSELNSTDLLFPTRKGTDVLKAIPVITLAFSCQFNVPPIYKELRARSLARMDRVVVYAHLAWCIVYISIGTAGALAFPDTSGWPDAVKGDVLTTFPCQDKLIFAARCCMFVVSCCTTPLLALPLRWIVHSLIKDWMSGNGRGSGGGADGHGSDSDLSRESEQTTTVDADATLQQSTQTQLSSDAGQEGTCRRCEPKPRRRCSNAVSFVSYAREGDSSSSSEAVVRVVMTVVLLGAAFGVGISLGGDLSFVVGIVGSTGATFLCIIMPSLFFIKASRSNAKATDGQSGEQQRPRCRSGGEALGGSSGSGRVGLMPYIPVVVGTVVGLVSTAFVLIGKIKGE